MPTPERLQEEGFTDTATRYAAFRKHISSLGKENPDGSLNVPGEDPLQQSFFQALDAELEDGSNTVLVDTIETALEMKPDRSIANMGYLLLRHFQDSELRLVHPEIDYTEGFENPDTWRNRPMARLAEDPTELVHFWMNIDLNTRTNFPQRGVLVKLATMMIGYSDAVHMLDVGSSRNHVAKKLAYPNHDRYSYDPLTVKLHTPDSKTALVDPYSPFIQGMLAARELPIASIVGIDMHNLLMPDTPKDQIKSFLRSSYIPEALKQHFWSRNNLYPIEYRDKKERIIEYGLLDSLESEELPTVKFFQGDATDLDHDKFEHTFPEQPKADIAYMLFSGYQMREEGVAVAVENLKQHMHPNGKVLLFDHAEVHPDGSLKFINDWAPWTATVAVLDLAKQEKGFTELFKVKNGRASEIMFNNESSRMAIRRLIRSAR